MIPTLDDSIREGERLLALVDGEFPRTFTTKERRAALLWAYLGRAAGLFRSMLTLARAQQTDAIAVLYRTLLEAWLHGAYLAVGGEEALAVIEVETDRQAVKIAAVLDIAAVRQTEGEKRLSVDELAKKLRVSLADDFPTRAYDNHYRVTSFHDAHGHLGALIAYLSESGEAVEVHASKVDPQQLEAIGLFISMGVSLVGGLANLVSDNTALPIKGLRALLGDWQSRAEG